MNSVETSKNTSAPIDLRKHTAEPLPLIYRSPGVTMMEYTKSFVCVE